VNINLKSTTHDTLWKFRGQYFYKSPLMFTSSAWDVKTQHRNYIISTVTVDERLCWGPRVVTRWCRADATHALCCSIVCSVYSALSTDLQLQTARPARSLAQSCSIRRVHCSGCQQCREDRQTGTALRTSSSREINSPAGLPGQHDSTW